MWRRSSNTKRWLADEIVAELNKDAEIVRCATYYVGCLELDDAGRPMDDYDRDCAAIGLKKAVLGEWG